MIQTYCLPFFLIAALLLISPDFNSAHRRISSYQKNSKSALVIGNEAYPAARLRNPANDARAIASVLTDLGFQVSLAVDVKQAEMEKAIDRFIQSIEPGGVALFYYAGHGIQIDGENYLIPIDFVLKDEADAKYTSYSASRVTERMERSGSRMNLIILDACRDNPFRAMRSSSRGLALMTSGQGTFIAFATGPGQTASDSPDRNNGLFTGHLVNTLRELGLSLDQIFSKVREKVALDSSRQQVPWTASNVIGDFYFNSSRPASPAPRAASSRVIEIPELKITLTEKDGIYYCSNGLPVCPKPLSMLFDGRGGCCALSAELRSKYQINQGLGPNAEEIISGLVGVWKGKKTFPNNASMDITLTFTRSDKEVFAGKMELSSTEKYDLYKIASDGKRFGFLVSGVYYSGTIKDDLMEGDVKAGNNNNILATFRLTRVEK